MSNAGRLPLPRGRRPATVTRALRQYDRAYMDEQSTFTERKIARALLHMYLEEMTRDDLAHYYAAVRQRLVAT